MSFPWTCPVVVLGMHRSGTSAVAGCLERLGVCMGRRLSPGDAWNPGGYFEDSDLVGLNDRLLNAHGIRWDALHDGALPDESVRQAHVTETMRWADEAFGHNTDAWGFKDPRVCRLEHFWSGWFDDAGLSPRMVVVLRHPREIAHSLQRRDGMSVTRSIWLWMRHIEGALQLAATNPDATWVDFARLTRQPEAEIARLAGQLGLEASSFQLMAARNFIDASFTHPPAGDYPSIPDWASAAHEMLIAAVAGGLTIRELAASADWQATLTRSVRERESISRQFRELFAGDTQLDRLELHIRALSLELRHAERLAGERLSELAALNEELDKTRSAFTRAEQLALDRLAELRARRMRVRMSDHGFVCQVDHLICREGALFGYGWALADHASFHDGVLLLAFDDGRSVSVRVSINRERKDVSAVYPHIPHAPFSGFMFMAGWKGSAPVSGRLEFRAAEGNTYHSELDVTPYAQHSPASGSHWKRLSQRIWRLLRKGDLGGLWVKARRFQTIGSFSREGSVDDLTRLLGGKPARLIIDHNMGGGANLFRHRQIQDWLDSSTESVILLTFNLSQMGYLLEIHVQGKLHRRRVTEFGVIAKVMRQVQLREVLVNCLVSFPNLLVLEAALYDWVSASKAHLIVAIHEYFMICPSHFLLDWRGHYCGIPSEYRVCQQCLSQHRDGFVSLTGERSISAWRQTWGKLFTRADEIRCFSTSSMDLMQRAYPSLKHQLTLTPHRVANLRIPQLSARHAGDPLVLGVVGSITEHKGAGVLDSLSRAIEENGLPVRIVILGNLDANLSQNRFIVTGTFQTEDLPDLFERLGIHLALMPSICPETFSFVTHELMSMRVPIACFNLGAQGEAVSRYPRGHILKTMEGSGILAELMAFADNLTTRSNRSTFRSS